MAGSSVSKSQVTAVTAVTAVAFLLTCIATGSPGWQVIEMREEGTNTSVSVQYSIFYARYCRQDGCEVVGKAELLTEKLHGSRLTFRQMHFASAVLISTIPIALLVSVLALEVRALRTRSWKLSFTTFCMVATSIAVTMQWLLIVPECIFAATLSMGMEDTEYFTTLANGNDAVYVSVSFPWCVLVYGVAALLLTAVALYFTLLFLTTAQAPETSTTREYHEMPAAQYVVDNQRNQEVSKTAAY